MATEQQTDNMYYTHPDLATVATRQEVKMLWGKAYNQIDLAIAQRRIDARTSLTGGTVLISVISCLRFWGPPDDKSLFRMYRGRSTPFDGFREAMNAPKRDKND